MELKNMKVSKKDMEKTCEPCGVMADAPQYPWGLSIRLEEDSISKLGLKDLPEAGETMLVMARVKVDNVGQTDSQGGGKRRNLSLQITDMALSPEEGEKDVADTIYPKGKA